jgi:hypothetical protein
MCQKLSNIKSKEYCAIQVTAKRRARSRDTGSKAVMIMAMVVSPNAAAQAAFIMINDITPLFTALPMRGPMGFWIAFANGRKIIAAKNIINGSVCKIFPLVIAT